jgi:hypothetical protein
VAEDAGTGRPPRGAARPHTYHVYTYPGRRPEAVKQGFSWPGFFFTWIWAVLKHLPGPALGLLVAGLLAAASNMAVGIFLLGASALWAGLQGNAWRGDQLTSRGYKCVAIRDASSAKAALAMSAAG